MHYPATGHCKYFLCSYGVKGFDLKILQSVYLINHILFFCGVFLSPIDQHTLFIGRAKADHWLVNTRCLLPKFQLITRTNYTECVLTISTITLYKILLVIADNPISVFLTFATSNTLYSRITHTHRPQCARGWDIVSKIFLREITLYLATLVHMNYLPWTGFMDS